jgi:hypothetical protein
MGTNFAPYVDQVLPVLFRHMNVDKNAPFIPRAVRKNVMKMLKFCLAAKNGEPALLHKMFDQFAFPILTAIKKRDCKELKLAFKCLYLCFDAAKDAG